MIEQLASLTDEQLAEAIAALAGSSLDELIFVREAAAMEQDRRASGRAFCPDASPPDNSCSPANKGSGDSYGFTTKVEESKDAWGKSTYTLPSGEVKKNYSVSLSDPATGGRASLKVGAYEDEASDFRPTATEITIVSWHASPLQDIVDGGLEGAYKKNVGKGFGRRVMAVVLETAIEHDADVVSVFAPSDHTQAVMEKYTADGLFTPIPSSKAVAGDFYTEFTINKDKVPEFLAETKRRVKASKRAFCPTGVGGGIDNSCSSKDGTGIAAAPPSKPEPLYNQDDPQDPRSEGGYMRMQREFHLAEVTKWLKDTHGIDVDTSQVQDGDPPSMGAIRAMADGVARLSEAGLQDAIPKKIYVRPTAAAAAYDYARDHLIIHPDFSQQDQEKAIREFRVAGDSSRPTYAAMVHEATHRDHMWRIAELNKAPGEHVGPMGGAWDKARDAFANMAGNPEIEIGETIRVVQKTDPWDVAHRVGSSSRSDAKAARRAAGEVSKYAMTTPLEFVAEVRTGVVSGFTYSDEVMRLYEDYGGPPLPRAAKKKKAA